MMWDIRGIVSASLTDAEHGCDINKFSLYTNVSWFLEWIRKVMEETKEVIYEYVDFKCSRGYFQ